MSLPVATALQPGMNTLKLSLGHCIMHCFFVLPVQPNLQAPEQFPDFYAAAPVLPCHVGFGKSVDSSLGKFPEACTALAGATTGRYSALHITESIWRFRRIEGWFQRTKRHNTEYYISRSVLHSALYQLTIEAWGFYRSESLKTLTCVLSRR